MKETIFYPKGRVPVAGIHGGQMMTIGRVPVKIDLTPEYEIEHMFLLVDEKVNIKYDGIIGGGLLRRFKCILNWNNSNLDICMNGFVTKQEHNLSYNLPNIILAPRTETVIEFIIPVEEEIFCHKIEVRPGVVIGNMITRPHNGKIPIPVINLNEKKVDLDINQVILKYDYLKEYQVMTLDYNQDPVANRLEKLKTQIDVTHCNQEEGDSILGICNDLFHLDGDYLTCTDLVTHRIPTIPNIPAVNTRPYRLPEANRKEVDRQVQEMLEQGIVQPSKSSWNSPLLLVPKKPDAEGNKKWRVVVDFRKVNEITIGDSYPLPNITDILDQLGHSQYFSTLDLASGYHQIPMDPMDRHKTAFTTPYGFVEYTRMPFGLKSAGSSFQRLMNAVLAGLQGMKCFVYLDDVVIYGKSLLDHNQKLREVFDRLREANLKLQPEKCHFLNREIIYLGHIVGTDGIKPDPGKFEAVDNFPQPKTPKQIKSFLGLTGYYRRFIKDYADIAKPLTRLLKKDVKFIWSPFCDEAFKILKNKLITAPVLIYPKFDEEFLLTTDASGTAIGGILSQGKLGEDQPVCCASKTLSESEIKYSTIERECFAIVYMTKHFRPYLYGRKFTIVTDHKPLIWLMNAKDQNSRLMR